MDRADINVASKAHIADFDRLNLSDLRVDVTQAGQDVATVSASGSFGVKSQEADLKANVEAALPKLAQLLNNPDLAISSGVFKSTAP